MTDPQQAEREAAKDAEIERLQTERAGDQQRLFHLEGALERLQRERDELYGYVNGLLGLLQLVRSRDDMPLAISEVLRTNHRATDAAAYLTQIVPPEKSP
jgi:hypothetical protein